MLSRYQLPSIYAFISYAAVLSTVHAYADEAVIAIIIDDMGYGLSEGYQALDLPGPLAYSFLPHAPNTSNLSAEAARHGKDVLTLNVLIEVLTRLQNYDVSLIAVRELINARKHTDHQTKPVALMRVSVR